MTALPKTPLYIDEAKFHTNDICEYIQRSVVLLQEWIPVINQDTVRQQNQRPQPPYSDAYLQGLPAKRRKVNSSILLVL